MLCLFCDRPIPEGQNFCDVVCEAEHDEETACLLGDEYPFGIGRFADDYVQSDVAGGL